MATVVLCDSGKERLIMPVAGATFHSFNMPSIGKILHAVPKALVGFLAAFSGISNARSIVSPFAEQHGGGLQTEAHARWQSHWQPQMQACLSEPWTHHFDPDRDIVDCTLRGIARWQKSNEDRHAPEVISRSLAHYKLSAEPIASAASGPTPDELKRIMVKVEEVMSTNKRYDRTMELTKSLLRFFSLSPDLEGLEDPNQRYTADRLIEILNNGLGLDPFKVESAPLSYELNKMARSAANQIYRLNPELIRSPTHRASIGAMLNEHFVARDAAMGEQQFHNLLSLLAQHMNERNSQWVA